MISFSASASGFITSDYWINDYYLEGSGEQVSLCKTDEREGEGKEWEREKE